MRKLATAALAFSAAIFLASYILPQGRLIVPAVLAAVLGAALSLLHRKWLRPLVIALLFFSLGLLEYDVYSHLTLDRAEQYAGQTREVSGVVLDYPDVYEGYCRLRIRVSSPELPRFKALVYDNQKAFLSAEPGNRVRFTAKISAADTLYGKPYDNYRADGFYWKLSVKGEEELTAGGFSLFSVPVRLRRILCQKVDGLFPDDCRTFVKALMLGEKQDFYNDDALYVAMSRSGLMHIAAVSGLHIVFLVGLLGMLFGNGRRGALTSIVLIWCFVLVTGSSVSAVRAAFMQTVLLLAPILRRENDPVTSLSFVLALILAVCPFSAKSVSLQLSFAAMAGIVCFGEGIYAWLLRPLPENRRHGPLAYVLGVVASSLSVMVFTTPLTALHFSYVPLLSIFSNIACIWAVSLCFCLSWAACLLSPVPLLGAALTWTASWLARYVLFCAGKIAALPYAVLYMKTEGALTWMLASYALLLLGLLLRKRRFLRLLLPGGLSLALLCFLFLRTESRYRTNDYMSVLNVGQGQCITAFADDVTAVIDCGNTSSIEDAGSIAGEYLLSCGRRSIELLILTHLHADHADGVTRLMELLPVDTLILPADAEDSAGLLEKILASAERHGTRVTQLARDAEANVGRIRAQLWKLTGDRDENERCLTVRLSIGETDLLTTADAPKRLERALAAREDLSGTEVLVAGHHGSKYAGSKELLREAGGGLAVISVGYNTYGHPAQETLDALEQYGYRIMRTDREGTVEIRLERAMAKRKDEETFNYAAELRILRERGPERLYLLWGPEDYLREQFLLQLKKKCLPEGEDGFSYKRLDGPALDLKQLRQAADVMPFMTERTFVELRDVDLNRLSEPEELVKILMDIPEYCTVCFVQNAQFEPDGRLRAVKALRAQGKELKFTQASQGMLTDWIVRRFAAAGKGIELAAAQRLIFISGDLMSRLIPEIEKIAAYARGEKVTQADVEAVASHIPEAVVFEMTELIAQKKNNSAFAVLSELLADKNNEPIMMLAVLGKQMRQLYAARLALDRGLGIKYLTEVCSIKYDYVASKLLNAAKGFPMPQLVRAVELCAETDYRMKSAGTDPRELLKEAVLRIAAGECHAED